MPTKKYSWKALCDNANKDEPKRQVVYQFADGKRVFTVPDNEYGRGIYEQPPPTN